MRDLAVALVVFGSLPFLLRKPFWGILMLAWLGFMNPHRLCYGFMLTMPVVQIVAVVTLVGMLISKEAKRMVWTRETVILVMFIVWMGITTTQAFNANAATDQYIKVLKVQVLTFMTLVMVTDKNRVHLVIWVIALSLGFYGIKGGIFTIVHGGAYRVQGPSGTFIGGNNETALALVVTIPLLRYLHLQAKSQLLKLGLAVGMGLTAIAAVGSQSRGALVALAVTGVIFWLKSRSKIVTAASLAVLVLVIASIMPESWYLRMQTIQTYDSDQSAIGRLNAWWTAFHLANDRIFGGGFETWVPAVFARYAPDPTNVRDVHSIYFEVLGEHGYIGLAMFVSLLVFVWLTCRSIRRIAKENPDLFWARDLAAMIQVSLVGYASAGAFLGLAYFDLVYYLIVIVVVIRTLVVAPQPVAGAAIAPEPLTAAATPR